MNKIFALLLATFLLPGTLLAKDECEFRDEVVDPDTQEVTIRTTWEKVTHDNEPGETSTTTGRVNATKEGETVMLGVLVPITYYYPIPSELGIDVEDTNIITKKGVFDERLDPYIEEWETTPISVLQGSGLRITLADQTTVMLATVRDVHGKTTVTKPQWDNNFTSFFRVTSNLGLRYVLDADAIASLTEQPIQSMRLDTGDRYYNFGGLKLVWSNRIVNKKSRTRIQKALKCIL